MNPFTETLLRWYDENARDLPWRGELDPYKIWVSEIILQQTRVNQGWDYYLRFIENFPDIASLASAPQEKVLKTWQGLGYYSRARNMHEAAKTIMEKFNGRFPETHKEIITLKGIGDYTAAAIASMAFGESHPAVDGNVFRVICRNFGVYDDIQLGSTKKLITEKCKPLMHGADPGRFNQAMMDFGAMQCTPKSPDCLQCPFLSSCYAFNNNAVSLLPVKIKKINIKSRYFHYLFFTEGSKTIIQQRKQKDIWQSLFQFPLIESSIQESLEATNLLQSLGHTAVADWTIRHQLSHQLIYASFYHIPIDKLPVLKENEIIVDLQDINAYPFPKIIAEYLARWEEVDKWTSGQVDK